MNKLKAKWLVVLIGLSTLSLSVAGTISVASTHALDCKNGRCQFIIQKTGEQCKNCVQKPGDAYCWSHSR